MNLVFHIVAVIALLLLAAQISRLQSHRATLRRALGVGAAGSRLLAGGEIAKKVRGGYRIRIDWPQKYLKSLGSACGVSVEITSAFQDPSPVKIGEGDFFEFILRCGLSSIVVVDVQSKAVQNIGAGDIEAQASLDSQGRSQAVCTIQVRLLENVLESDSNMLEQALGGCYSIQIV